MDIKTYDFAFLVDDLEVKYVKAEFEKAFKYYESKNYNEEDTLMCSLHSAFDDEGHCCVGCNMEESSKLIINYLMNYSQFSTAESTFPNFIFLLYLMVERIEEYLNIMELQRSVKERNFKVFSVVKQWANFIKHPKASMLVHHPHYIYEGFDTDLESWKYKKIDEYDLKIDNGFVKEFYSGGDNNKKLYDRLIKKENVLVIYPNPSNLLKEFCDAQIYFVKLICENPILRQLLSEKATKYYSDDE